MYTPDDLKAKVQAAIDDRREWLIDVAKTVLDNPEPGFQEVKTSAIVSRKLTELGIAHETGHSADRRQRVPAGREPRADGGRSSASWTPYVSWGIPTRTPIRARPTPAATTASWA